MEPLKTTGLNSELTRLRKSGLTLPTNARKAAEQYKAMTQISARDSLSNIKRAGMSRSANIGGGGVQMSMEKVRNPTDRFIQSQIPFLIGDQEERKKIREMCRIYYATHNLQPLCHPAGTLIDVEGSQIAIEDVKEGALVRTHLGRYREVKDLKSFNYEGEMFTFATYKTNRHLEATPDHPLYVFRRTEPIVTARRTGNYTNGEYLWVKAADIKIGDFLVTPVLNEEEDTSFIINSQTREWTLKASTTYGGTRNIPERNCSKTSEMKLEITPELMRLVGYFISDGYAKPAGRVQFYFGRHETQYVNDTVDLISSCLGKTAKIFEHPTEKMTTVSFHYKNFAEWLGKEFGSNAHTKNIPAWVQVLPVYKQIELLKGFWRGDGCSTPKEVLFDSVSSDLIYGITTLLQRAGIEARTKMPVSADFYRTIGNQKPSHIKKIIGRVSVSGNSADRLKEIIGLPVSRTKTHTTYSKGFLLNGYQHLAVKSIESSPFIGKVYNFEVEEDESYVANGFSSHNCIDIFANFPIQGMSITSKDPELTKFYEELFFNQLEYETFLEDFGREFFTIGEVNSLATYSETLGIWESEQIINPDDLTVSVSPFSKDHRYHLAIPQEIKDIIENMKPRADYEILLREYPEMVEAARQSNNMARDDSTTGEGLEISNVLLSRAVSKNSANDLYGSPRMLRAFTLLNLEEGLYAAQKAVADRLYSPLILAKLGSPDLGDGEPWVPDEDQLQNFTDQMSQAMSADFKFLAYHFGIEIESVFGRESVPRFDQDFDRIESKMLEVWGIGESLISGGDAGAYASSALNSELVTQLMSSYQKRVKLHFKKRVEVVAEAQGHFDYNVSNGVRTPIMEEYLEIEEDGTERVRKRPKLLLPEINFSSINLRDETTERQFLMQLQQAGVPISAKRLLLNTDIDFKEEINSVQEEQIQLVMADVEAKQRMIRVLTEREQPLPQELRTIQQLEQMPPPPPMGVSMPVPNLATNPMNTPTVAPNQMAQQIAMQNAQAVQGTAGAGNAPAPGAPGAPSAPPPAPAMGAPSQPDTQLPQNWISQRPEISDNQRAGMPTQSARTKSSMRHDPSTIGLRNLLTPQSIDNVVNERPWTRSLGHLKDS